MWYINCLTLSGNNHFKIPDTKQYVTIPKKFQLDNHPILKGFDLVIMGALVHTVVNNKYRDGNNYTMFTDILVDIYSKQMTTMVKVFEPISLNKLQLKVFHISRHLVS